MYPGVPLRTVNGRFALRSEEMPAGFWCGLHPREKNNKNNKEYLSVHDYQIIMMCSYSHILRFGCHQHIPNNVK